ncbi:MAG: ATP-dependent Clp protease adaptor ClpS [Salinivirgaceae bacterium]|nr:ATP-dependent Clp protease adaptor ClpS [Salinivirgaceae bacterium]
MEETITKKELKNSVNTNTESSWHLLLWNDDVNDMFWITKALFEVCHLKEETAVATMIEAHTHGQSIAKSGGRTKMETMKQGLNDRYINASVVKDETVSN